MLPTIDRRNWPLWNVFDIKRISLNLSHHESMYHGLYASITSFAQIDTPVDTLCNSFAWLAFYWNMFLREDVVYTIYSLWMHAQNYRICEQ
jgi:hypothetical protein